MGKYLSLIKNFVSISYKDLTSNDLALQKLCASVKIEYYETKKCYWERKQHSFFGSNSVKFHNAYNINRQLTDQTRKDITYYGVNDETILKFVEKAIIDNRIILKIESEIRKYDILNTNKKLIYENIGYNKILLWFIFLKQYIKRTVRYYFPQNIFK